MFLLIPGLVTMTRKDIYLKTSNTVLDALMDLLAEGEGHISKHATSCSYFGS